MTPENIRDPKVGWMLWGFCAPSKCDRDLTESGDQEMWFRYNPADPWNFAAAWLAWELEFPCPMDQREQWAAFSPDGGRNPYTTKALQRDFHSVVLEAIGAIEAALRTWHALRVTTATALCTAKRPDGAIQCVVR